MSLVVQSNPDKFLEAVNTAASTNYTCLLDAWLNYLQMTLGSTSSDLEQLEVLWLLQQTAQTAGVTEDLWNYYLKDIRGYSGSIVDMLNDVLVDDSLFSFIVNLLTSVTDVREATRTVTGYASNAVATDDPIELTVPINEPAFTNGRMRGYDIGAFQYRGV